MPGKWKGGEMKTKEERQRGEEDRECRGSV